MNLNPARCRSHSLSSILHAPAFDKADTNGAHASELVDGFESFVDGQREVIGEILIVEDTHVAAGWDLADGGRVPAVAHVGVWALDEDGGFAVALRPHLPAHVEEVHSTSYVPASLLYHLQQRGRRGREGQCDNFGEGR